MPADWHAVLADLAMVFHWPPSELWDLPLDDLWHWHAEAKKRLEAMYG